MDNAFQHSTIAQIIENILEQFTFEGESKSNIADILLSILNKTEYNEDPHSVIGDLLIRLKAKIEGESYDPYDAAYTSRIAEILISILEETEYTEEPQSRIAELLLQLKEELEDYTELTASGSVASFITNCVKPLVNGEFTIAAYQEGSGDPSPVNIRNIVGFSEQNITHAHKNLFDINNPFFTAVNLIYLRNYNPVIEDNKIYNGGKIGVTAGGGITIPAIEGAQYTVSCIINGENVSGEIRAVTIGTDGVWTSNQILAANVNGNVGDRISRTVIMPSGYTHLFTSFYSANKYGSYETDFQIEVGSTATDYEPYIEPEIKTVDLGEDVYGGSYNSDTGDKRKTWNKKTVGELSFTAQSGNRFTAPISDCVNTPNFTGFLCSTYKPILVNENNNTWLSNRVITIVDNRFSTATEFKEAMGDTQIVYPIAEPIESNIGATEIKTFDGVNNIFCDTGDSSVTYLYKGTPPATLNRVMSKSPDVEDIIKEEELEDLKDLDELQDPDISDKEVK
jgi:hypothetical protein